MVLGVPILKHFRVGENIHQKLLELPINSKDLLSLLVKNGLKFEKKKVLEKQGKQIKTA